MCHDDTLVNSDIVTMANTGVAGRVKYHYPKKLTWSPHSDNYELVLVFIPYYYQFDIDFSYLCVQL